MGVSKPAALQARKGLETREGGGLLLAVSRAATRSSDTSGNINPRSAKKMI